MVADFTKLPSDVSRPYSCLPFLIHILAHLCRHPMDLPRRKRRRKRGKQWGLAARLKYGLAREKGALRSSFSRWDQLHECGIGMGFPESQFQRPRIIITAFSSLHRHGLYVCDHLGRVNLHNLWPLCRATQLESDSSLLKMALINARSLVNKTYILNEYFTAKPLDFLCLTETWIKPCKSCSLDELLPQGCSFLNTPRLSGHGGSLVTVFKNAFTCRSLSTAQYNSFEVQLFQILLANPVTIALVYRPPLTRHGIS